MSSYKKFAEVYDELMQDVPYNEYVRWITKHAPSNEYPKLLDVGCGTGTLAIKFQSEGYEVSGVDISEEMLSIANERFLTEGISIPLYQMSMDELEGFTDLDVITIPIDSVNYLESESDVVQTLTRAYESLRSGGQLFFDVHSQYKMDEIFMQGPFTYDDGELVYVWHTVSGDFIHSVYHLITFFVKDHQTGLFERFDEEHFQRTYPVDQYIRWLKEIGFSDITITADFTDESPADHSERIFIRAVKDTSEKPNF